MQLFLFSVCNPNSLMIINMILIILDIFMLFLQNNLQTNGMGNEHHDHKNPYFKA